MSRSSGQLVKSRMAWFVAIFIFANCRSPDRPRQSRFNKLADGIRAGMALLRNFSDQAPPGKSGKWTESGRTTAAGTAYDLYQPVGKIRKTAILVPGITLAGNRDPRVVNFSRALAMGGIRMAAIDLPGLKAFEFKESDPAAIADLATTLQAESGAKIGVIAFSLGGSEALVAVSDPAVSSMIDPLIVFGPYYQLAELEREILRKLAAEPVSDLEWDDYIWYQMFLADREPAAPGWGEKEKRELESLLGDYCQVPLERKREYYERALKGRPGLSFEGKIPPEAYEKLSPAGKLKAIRGRVIIFHDQNDTMIPPSQSREIYAELQRGRKNGDQRLLITPLLSHVNARASWQLLDFFRICAMMGTIYQ